MTSKHFEAFARAIADITDEATAAEVSKTITGVAKDLNPRFDEDRFSARVEELKAINAYDARRKSIEDSPTGFILTLEQRERMMYGEFWEMGHHELVEALGDHTLTHDPKLTYYQEYFDTMDEVDQVKAMADIEAAG
jgi:hypothetical protein